MSLDHLIDVASGRQPADIVFKNGSYVNVFTNTVETADIAIADDRIAGIGAYEGREVVDLKGQVLCPGFIDAHVHIESSMLSVPEFARTVVAHGTTAVFADPHEIANVMGAEGIRFVLRSSKFCPIYVYVMLSSCVPASPLESAGAELSAIDLHPFLSDRWVHGLAEMMNFPGVINKNPEVLDKIRIAGGTPIDGHAPGLTGRDLCAYVAAGIRNDHEVTTLEEGREKLRMGMHIMIREGSGARNLDALLPLITADTVGQFMFVTDDKHVDDLLHEGQIDCMVRRAIAAGISPAYAVRLGSFNAARYYGLTDLGAIAPGYMANMAVLENLQDCRVSRVYKDGQLVAVDGHCIAPDPPASYSAMKLRASLNVKALEEDSFVIRSIPERPLARIIEVIPDQLVTREVREKPTTLNSLVVADVQRDLLKMAVIERHSASGNIGLGLVRGFGLKRGAIASTVAHDAHNMIVVGVNDHDMLTAARHLVDIKGGLCVVGDGEVLADLPLPIAGLLSDQNAETVVQHLEHIKTAVNSLGTTLPHPFVTLSFMSLSVIGDLKLTDRGLADVRQFKHVDLFVKQ